MRWVLGALVVVATVGAGCLGGSDAEADDDEAPERPASPTVDAPDAPVQEPEPLVATLPAWELGDWWRYEVDHGPLDVSFTYDVVVARANAQGYVLAASDDDGSIMAFFTHYPTIGPVSPDLKHAMHGFQVDFFSFPFADGSVWTNPYRNGSATYTAAEVTLGDGTRALQVTASIDGPASRLQYEWVPGEGYFHGLRFAFATTGPWNHELTLVSYGSNYTGNAPARWVEDVIHLTSPDNALPVEGRTAPAHGEFTVPAEAAEVLFGLFSGGPGEKAIEVVAPSGTVHEIRASPSDTFGLQWMRLPVEDGTYRVLAAATEGAYFAEGYAMFEDA